MEHLHYSIQINAPQQKVWDTMLGEETYKEWSSVFNPDPTAETYMEGSWDEGSDIKFLGKEKDGTVSGMIGKVQESRPGEFISVKYSSEIMRGEENVYAPDELYFATNISPIFPVSTKLATPGPGSKSTVFWNSPTT